MQLYSSKRILIVEDEQEIRKLIALHLTREGYQVAEFADGEQARTACLQNAYDLIIVDWMLPSLSGLELTRWLRRHETSRRVPILFITAKAEAEQIAVALDAGADDYMPKPFDTLVLMARVNALLRRGEWLKGQSENNELAKLTVGQLTLDPQTYEAVLAGSPLELTRSEFRLLETLMKNQGKVLSRESLIAQIQGDGIAVVGRTIDTHVFGLRKKLGAHADLVETIRGVGYRVRHLNLGE